MAENPPIYGDYMQKSYAFLFPLLGLKRSGDGVFLPDQTYLGVKGLYKPYDLKLIASYRNYPDNPGWLAYQQNHLLSHAMLDVSTEIKSGRKVLYIFDLQTMEQDVQHFLKGKYSLLSTEAKKLLCTYYGVRSKEWGHMNGYLWPEKARRLYAKHLGMDEDELAGQELCQPYDPHHELLSADLSDDFVDQLVLT